MEVDKFRTDVYSPDVNYAIDKWKDAVVSDGSIPGGFEINTNPTNGDLFLDHMAEICDGFVKINAHCSNACGLHVHVNVKGSPLYSKDGSPLLDKDGNQKFDPRDAFNHYDLRRLIEIYYKTEKAIFELCHPRRVSGRYSIPCGPYYMTKDMNPKDFRKSMITKMYREGQPLPVATPASTLASTRALTMQKVKRAMKEAGTQLKAKKGHKYESVRYKALNLHSFFLRGTIEFRHKEGTADYNEITNWALICATVVDQASKMSHAEISELPNKSREALVAILPAPLRAYALRKWEQNENTIPRYGETVRDVWRNLANNDD
jgi:hypothetical protein